MFFLVSSKALPVAPVTDAALAIAFSKLAKTETDLPTAKPIPATAATAGKAIELMPAPMTPTDFVIPPDALPNCLLIVPSFFDALSFISTTICILATSVIMPPSLL